MSAHFAGPVGSQARAGPEPERRLRAEVQVRRGGFLLDAALDVGPGEVLAVLGPNGAGKTTLLRTLAGLQRPTAGRVVLGPTVLDDPSAGLSVPPPQRRVGVVFQEYRLFEHLSVLDNVAFGHRVRGARPGHARLLAQPWVERLGLLDVAGRRPRSLSGGQAQRVAVARALASAPHLLLLDEPLSALDAGTRVDLRADLREHLSAFSGPSVVVTHDALEAFMLADQVLVLEAGRVVQRGATVQVARRPATEYVARLLGLNLYRGRAADGVVTVDAGARITVADRHLRGSVLVALRPSAVAVHRVRPEGSARNVWPGRVTSVQQVGDRARLVVDGALSVLADVTPAALTELDLRRGVDVWMSVKATEIEAYQDAHAEGSARQAGGP